MGPLARMLGAGVGLASEAMHARRNRSRDAEPDTAAAPSSNRQVSASIGAVQEERLPPYSEVAGTREAGRSERYDNEKKSNYQGDGKNEDSESDTDIDDDEEAWELDDMSSALAPPSYEEIEAEQAVAKGQRPLVETDPISAEAITKDLVQELINMAGPPPAKPQNLMRPVVLPQRRPREKSRGFVRAYAPSLEASGISQDLFLKFLKNLDKASKSDPWIDVIFISSQIAGFVPEAITQAVTLGVSILAGTARELQSRTRRNTFLDHVNQELLMPRGLYAMIFSFKDNIPNQSGRSGPISTISTGLGSLVTKQRLSINDTVLKYSKDDPDGSKMRQGLQNLRLSSGTSYGELEIPDAAPLIYPYLDKAVDDVLNDTDTTTGSTSDKGKGKDTGIKAKLSSAGSFVQDYLDRRAQAQYGHENPNSRLAMPEGARPTFASRFSDPNHPANSGSLISLLTGGAVNPAERKQQRRQRRRQFKDQRKALKREYRDERRIARGKSPKGPRRQRKPRKQKKGTLRKLLQQDVLYLLVVNLPTEQDVKDSTETLNNAIHDHQFA